MLLCNVVFQSLQLRVANLSHTAIVAFTLGPFSLQAQSLYLLLVLLNLVYQLAFALPLGAELGLLFAKLGNLLVELGEFFRVLRAL